MICIYFLKIASDGLTVSHNSFRMAVVYVLMYFKCKICFTVYTGETKINDTYLLTYLLTCYLEKATDI